MTNPNPASMQFNHGVPLEACDNPDEFDYKNWVMRNIRLDDPIELRRRELRGSAEAVGFENIDVRNLGGYSAWEMHFDRGINAECTTSVEVERWVGYFTSKCRCQIDPDRFVAVVEGKRIAARFFLQP